MKLNIRILSSLICLFWFIYKSIAKQDDCPRVQTFFDFQDENDQDGYKEVTAITHIQGSTLVAIGTKVGAIEIWDYDSREIITKFFEDLWPIERIDHIGHTNHIVVRYKRNNGNVVSIWDLVSQERALWIIDEKNDQNNYDDVFKQKVVDTYLSRNGNYFLQMSTKNVVACDIHNVNQNKPQCEIYPIGKAIQDEKPRYIFSFDSQFESVFFIMTKYSIYKIDRVGLSLSDKIFRVEDDDVKVEIVDMIRIQQDGIIMIALSSNELITFNAHTSNGSERIYKLRDYLQYISLNQITKLLEVKSFFSESCVLILFEVTDDKNKQQKVSQQVIMTYNINEDKILQFERIYRAKLISPINQSRSFIIVFEDDTVGWFAYPVILKSLPAIISSTIAVSSPSLSIDLQSNYKKQIIGMGGKVILQDSMEGFIVQQNINNNSLEKKYELNFDGGEIDLSLQSIISLDDINQFIVLTNNYDIIIYSYHLNTSDPLYSTNILALIYLPQGVSNLTSNSYLLKLNDTESVAIVTGYNIIVFNYKIKQITHAVSTSLQPVDLFIDCSLISSSNLNKNNQYYMVANGKSYLQLFTLQIGQKDNQQEISSDIIHKMVNSISSENIVGFEYIKENGIIITQDTRNEFCKYTLSDLTKISCFRIWYDEIGFQTNVFKKRGLLYIRLANILVAQLNDQRVVFIDLQKELPTFSTCKFDVLFYSITLLSNNQLVLVPSAVSKKNISFLDFYEEKPFNIFRNMKGIIQESRLYHNQIMLYMKDGSFKILNVEKNKLYELISAYSSFALIRKFLIENDTIIFIDSDNYLQTFEFDPNFKFVSFQNKFLISEIAVNNRTHLETTSKQNVVAIINDKSIFYVNYATQEIQEVYNSLFENITATDFNQTLSLIVVGLSDNRVQVLDVKDIKNAKIKHAIQTESKVVQVQHSIMFNDRIYFTHANKIIRWDVLTNTTTQIQQFDDNIKQMLFVLQIQAIVVSLDNGVVQIINDDKNLFYFINVRALTQSYAFVDSLIYMSEFNSLAFISNHRIWALQLHDFVYEKNQSNLTLTQIQCEKRFFIESMQGQEYFNILGQGTQSEPYKSVSAIRKETIKIGKSHKIFMYNIIKLNFFLQEGKTYQLEEPFQYATQKINSIVTFKTYKVEQTKDLIDLNKTNQKKRSFSFYDDEASEQPQTTLIIQNRYQFENIQKLFFYDISMQLGSTFTNGEEVKYSVFNNIDQISFIKCNFTPNKNNYDVYIFDEVQLLMFSDVKIKQAQFLSSNVKSIYLEKVESSLIPPSENISQKKKCIVQSHINQDLSFMKNEMIHDKNGSKYSCQYFFFYPTNSESYLFIEVINRSIQVDNQDQIKIQKTKTLLSQNTIYNDQNDNLNQNSLNLEYGSEQLHGLNKRLDNKRKLQSFGIKQNVNISQYTIHNCTFQYVKIFTFLMIKDSSPSNQIPFQVEREIQQTKKITTNNMKHEEITFLSPYLNISNSFIKDSTIFSGQKIDYEDSISGLFNNDYQNQMLIPLQFLLKNHTVTQSKFTKVSLYEGSTLQVKELSGLKLKNNIFDKFTIQIGKNAGIIIQNILILSNQFQSTSYIPLFELSEKFLLQNITLKNNSFNSQNIFAYKTDFAGASVMTDDSSMDDEQSDLEEVEEKKNQFSEFNKDHDDNDNDDNDDNDYMNQIKQNNSTISNIDFSNCTFQRTTIFSVNELISKQVLLVEYINIRDSSLVETKVLDILNLQKISYAHIRNMHIEQVSALRSCFIRKLSDQTLLIENVYIHRNIIRYSNFLQTKREPSFMQNNYNLLANMMKNITVFVNIWFNSKLAELSQNSLLYFTNSNITNNTFTSEATTFERLSKYLIELDHLLLEKVQLESNSFNYQLLCGPPLLNNQFVDYQIQKLNVINNIFDSQSNALLIEATFSIIQRGSQVRLSNLLLIDNMRIDSSVTRGTFLVEGYRFFFIHFDKIHTIQVATALMKNNTDMGFGVFKNTVGQSWINKLSITNDAYLSLDLNFNMNETLRQPLLIIRNGANFTLKNSVIQNMKVFNSPIIEIESNKNIYQNINTNNNLNNQESNALVQISNVTCTNNVIQIDPYLCLGSVIEFSSNIITTLKISSLSLNSNIIKGLNQNSLYQAQLHIAASQSIIQIADSRFAFSRDYRFVKNVADSMFFLIEARNITVTNSTFSSVPNNQTDELTKVALKFNLQVVGSLSYQTLKFSKCQVKSMRSSNLGIFELSTISDNSLTNISDSVFEDLIPKQTVFNLKGNLFSSTTKIQNNRFSYIFGQIINIDRICYVQLQILSNIFFQVYSQYNTLLDIMNTQKEISSVYFKKNQVYFNQTQLQNQFKYYSSSQSIYDLIMSRTTTSSSLLSLTKIMSIAFEDNIFSSKYSDNYTVDNLSMVFISEASLVTFNNNYFENIQNSYISTLSFHKIDTLLLQNLTIVNCSQINQQIVQFNQVSDLIMKDFIFNQNSISELGNYSCVQVKNSCMRATNLQISNNKCQSNGPFDLIFSKRLQEQSRCKVQDGEQQNENSENQVEKIAKYPISITNSVIENNKGLHFGAINILNNINAIIYINNTQILRNSCKGYSCGALFLTIYGNNNFFLQNTTIAYNYAANRGGGIYINQDIPNSLIKYDHNYIHDNISPSNIQVCSNGRLVRFKLQTDSQTQEHYQLSQKQLKILQINNQQSGGYLPTIIAEILDQEGQKVLPDDQQQANYARIFLSELTSSKGYFLKGDLQIEYNLEKGGFIFQNISIYGKPDSTINMTFATQMIEYEGLNSSQKLKSEYSIQIQVNLRKCIIGEVYFNNNLYESCQPCPEKEYSIEDPNDNKNLNCLECPKNADCPGRNQLQIHQGYWRQDDKSLEIIYCGTEPKNCKGGIEAGDKSCGDQMKGPLCEQCDIERGYTNISSSSCLQCSEIGWTLSIIISVLLFFLIYILISIDSTVRRIKHSRSISSKSGTNTVFVASMVVKLFVSYLQVVSILGTFQLNINPLATQGALSLGNPILSFSNAMDCYLYKIGKQIGVTHIYLNFLSSLLIPLVFMLFISLVDYLNNRKNYYYRSYFVKTMFLVILLFFAPLALQNGLKLITCRQVGDQYSYIQYNMLYQCFTKEYYTYSVMVVAPLTFIICVLIPLFLAFLIKKRKQRKVSIKTYQYLLGDYKDATYYWEFIKYTQKLAIMIISVYFSQDIKTKALFINMILISYGTIVFFVKPFRTDILNKLDIFTTLIIFLSIHFGLMAFEKSESNQVQWYFCIVILSIMNIPLFSWYIYTIFKCYAPWFSMKKRNIKIKLMRFRIFRSNYNPQERASFNWKNLFNKYIEGMKQQKLGGRGQNQQTTSDNEYDHIPFLKNRKFNDLFNSERTSDQNNITCTEEEQTNCSEVIKDYDEQYPSKVYDLRFKRNDRISLDSNKNKGEKQTEGVNRKRYHTTTLNKSKHILTDEINESQIVHKRFSQLIVGLKNNQENNQQDDKEQSNSLNEIEKKENDNNDRQSQISENDK